jgi:uncharacterized protein DUF3352
VKAAFLVVVLAASLAASGCGGSSSSVSPGAEFAPASAAAYVAIDTDPDSSQWQNADGLSRRFPGRHKAVSGLQESVRSDSGLDFEKDVRPALGPELDLVWLDLDNDGEDVVGLMQPADVAAFERAVEKGNASDPGSKLLYERVDGWEVMSDKRATIDAFKRAHAAGGPVLADDDSFRQAMGEYSSDAILKAYLSGARVMEKVRATVPADQQKTVRQLGELDWLATALQTSDDGVRLDATARGKPGKLLRSSSGGGGAGFELALPKALPADVLAYLGFHGAAGAFDGIARNPALAGAQFDTVRSIVRKVGRLFEGENALYVRPGKGRLPEITLVSEPRPGTDGVATLDRILADAGLGGHTEATQIAGADARRVAVGDGGPTLVYANVGDKLVVTDLDAGVAGVAQPGSKLQDAASFRDAVNGAGLPKNVASFFYVDVRGGLGLAEKLAGAPIPAAVKRNLGPLRSAVEYAASRPSEVQVTLFVRVR